MFNVTQRSVTKKLRPGLTRLHSNMADRESAGSKNRRVLNEHEKRYLHATKGWRKGQTHI